MVIFVLISMSILTLISSHPFTKTYHCALQAVKIIINGIPDSPFILDGIKNRCWRQRPGVPASSYSSSLGVNYFSLEAVLEMMTQRALGNSMAQQSRGS